MLDKQNLHFIHLFINNQLKDTQIIDTQLKDVQLKNVQLKNVQLMNIFNIFDNIDMILEQIKLHSQYKQFTKTQILQQLIIDTSYNSQQLCLELFSVYNYKYGSFRTLFNVWDVLYRLTVYAIKNTQYIFDIVFIYNAYIQQVIEFERINRSIIILMPKEKKEEKEWQSYMAKCTLLQSNGNDKHDNYSFKYKLKLIFIGFHKMFNSLSEDSYNTIIIPEVLMLLYKYYLPDFYLSLKDRKMCVNIIALTFIRSFSFQKNLDDSVSKYYRPWDIFLDIIFSNWSLIHTTYKQYIKNYGKEIIQFYYGYSKTFIRSQKEEKEAKRIFNILINDLSSKK